MKVLDQLLHFRSIGSYINRIMILITSSYLNYTVTTTATTTITSYRHISEASSIFKPTSIVRKESFNPRCRRCTTVTCISSIYLIFTLLVLSIVIIQPMNANTFTSKSIVVKETRMNTSDRIVSRYDSNNNIQKNTNNDKILQTDIIGYL